MRKLWVLLSLLLLAVPAWAQQAQSIAGGPTLPATCNPATRVVFFKTVSAPGLYQCLATNTWTKVPITGGGTGDVVGPASAVDGQITLFDSTTGKVIKAAGFTGLTLSTAGVASAYTGTSCTNQFPRSLDASGVATCASVNLASDVSGNLPVTNLNSGSSASNTTFWRGDGTWATPAGSGGNVSAAGTLTSGAIVIGQGAQAVAVGNLSGDVTTSGGTATTLANTAVTPASYTNTSLTVDSKGRITAASSGSAPAMVKIDEATPSATGVVTFSSLGSYTHLEILYSGRGDQVATSTAINLTFNGDTGANYDRQLMQGAAGTPTASESLGQTSAAIGNIAAASATASMIGSGRIVILDYRGTTFFKQCVTANTYQTGTGSGAFFTRQFSVGWRSAAAITSITLTLASGNYVAGTIFSLYGIQ